MQHEHHDHEEPTFAGADQEETPAGGPRSGDRTLEAGSPVVVRRAAGLSAVIGAGASAVAIAYLWRAVETGSVLDWALCGALALIAAYYLAVLLDARTPLVVADDLGVRIRLGRQWRGLPWEAVGAVEVRPRRSVWQDGRLVFRARTPARALEGLEESGRRVAALNQRLYGGALAVPLGITTRTSTPTGDGEAMVEGIAALAGGRAPVLLVVPEPAPEKKAEPTDEGVAADTAPAARVAAQPASAPPADDADLAVPSGAAVGTDEDRQVVHGSGAQTLETEEAHDADEAERPVRRSLLGGLGTIVSRFAKGDRHDVDHHEDAEETAVGAALDQDADTDLDGDHADDERSAGEGADAPLPTAVPLRAARRALRAEVTRDAPANTLGAAALHADGSERGGPLPEGRELRRPGSVDLVFEAPEPHGVRPIARLGEAVEPLVIDDFAPEPAYDPVIGPELAAARTRVGLTVDELAERTRIRPHVIESLEVDDFAPCGGDFYARGHLRTLARVLGQDPAPLLARFDERYATAPINARRVFEAELATGMTGSMRSTVGGPNWALLVGAVLVLVLVWGVVRLVATEPLEPVQSPVLGGAAVVGDGGPRAVETG